MVATARAAPLPRVTRRRRARALLLVLVQAAVLLWCAAAVQIAQFSRRTSSETADAALVLGAAAWGIRPSPVYRERIAQAIDLYDRHRVRWIILTGGTPALGYPSEAQVGRSFCLHHGIPEESLLVEDGSRTTWENLDGARAPMADHRIRTVLLVSDPLHMKRAVAMAKAQGMAAEPAPTETSRFRSWRSRAGLLWHETWLYLGFRLFGMKD